MHRNSSGATALAFGLLLLASTAKAEAAPIIWTDWTTADASSASGTAGAVTVSFSGNISPAAQTAGGPNYWLVNSAVYTSPEVDNAPPDSDIIRLTGGTATGVQTITFSAPVVNPVLAIMSLGQPGFAVTYVFGDEPFDVLNSGTGHWGGNPAGSLFEDPGNVLRGIEGHGIIQFNGTFSSISWTMPIAEGWHGFQVGIPASAPEPGILGLLGSGVAALALRRNRTRSRRESDSIAG